MDFQILFTWSNGSEFSDTYEVRTRFRSITQTSFRLRSWKTVSGLARANTTCRQDIVLKEKLLSCPSNSTFACDVIRATPSHWRGRCTAGPISTPGLLLAVPWSDCVSWHERDSDTGLNEIRQLQNTWLIIAITIIIDLLEYLTTATTPSVRKH
jgi:hypothetical protein